MRIFVKHRTLGLDEMFGLSKNQFLNGEYTFDIWYNATRKDYVTECGVNCVSRPFKDDKYVNIGNDSGKLRLGKEFGYIDFDDTKITLADLTYDLEKYLSQFFSIRILTNLEAIEMVRDYFDNTKVVEVSEGKFLYSTTTVTPDEVMGETIPVAGPEQDVIDNGDGTYTVKKYVDCNL